MVRAARRDPRASRGRRVILILLLIWTVNVFDLGFTLLGRQAGGFREANPVAAPLLDNSGLLIAFKLSLVLLASAILFACRRHWLTELSCWILFVIHTGLAFVWMAYYRLAA